MKSASDMRSNAGLPTLLLVLVGSVVGLCWWSLARPVADQDMAAITELNPSAGVPRASSESQELELAARRARTALEHVATAPDAQSTAPRAPRPGSERGLREKYLALEAAHPGHLAAHSQEWLEGPRPAAEKVAWLLALNDSDASAALTWLEFACKLDDPASAHGQAPAAFALESIARSSVADAGARAALGRLAADSAAVDVALRRRAASTLAALGDASDLQGLGQALLRESDEALRAGVVVALEARTDPDTRLAADRLLAWLRPASAAFLARHEDGNP